MSSLNGKWIEVFKAGNYGAEGRWTEGDLDALVNSYDAKQNPAPIVIGHPKTNDPAYGWVAGLRRVGSALQAQLEKVEPQFEQLLSDGRFRTRSVAIYKKFGATGAPYLGHIGFLGAAAPTVKGLQPASFHDGDAAQVVSVEFSLEEEAMQQKDNDKPETSQLSEENVGVLTHFAEKVRKLFGSGEAPPERPAPLSGATFTEAQVNKMLDDRDQKWDKQFAELKKETQEATAVQAGTVADARVTAFMEKLSAGKIAPAVLNLAEPIARHLAATPAELTFSEKDKKDKDGKPVESKKDAFDLFAELLTTTGAIVPTQSSGADQVKSLAKFNAEDLEAGGIDPESVVLLEKARKIQAEKKIEFAEALTLARQDDGLVIVGGMVAGRA